MISAPFRTLIVGLFCLSIGVVSCCALDAYIVKPLNIEADMRNIEFIENYTDEEFLAAIVANTKGSDVDKMAAINKALGEVWETKKTKDLKSYFILNFPTADAIVTKDDFLFVHKVIDGRVKEE